ncbi:MAG: DUF58 domain-containing protein [Actinobacteria bacterium]|uniref:Unannotated protein n=1 Tax=freshwater metagenome TaxID=449393 RepID=A0A6J6C140_9ZZZZ|nr:DUF58 domain-containing protein [Actinomycetota bacterium]
MRRPGWWPTTAHVRAGGTGLVLAVIGALARRPDAVVLATPLLAIAVWGALTRPRGEPTVTQEPDHHTLREGEATTWRVEVDSADPHVDAVAAVLWPSSFAELDPESGEVVDRPVEADAAGGARRTSLSIAVRSTRWGRRPLGPAAVVATSPWAAFRWMEFDAAQRWITTLPVPAAFDAVAPVAHTAGLVGLDRSVRTGDGSEFAGIRQFQPGDRLRRIHWPRSLRTGTLHVSSTWADHDHHVLLVVDAFNDVGTSEGVDGRASSLDATVRAAGALAEHHLRRGDRVSLHTLGARGLVRVPPGSGTGHLRRVLDELARVEPGSRLDDRRMPFGVGGGALVVVLSPLVSQVPLQRAVTLAATSARVVVVDTLPADLPVPGLDAAGALAWRIRLLERSRELRAVRAAGVPVVAWRGPGSLDQVLRDLSRRRGAPRTVRR